VPQPAYDVVDAHARPWPARPTVGPAVVVHQADNRTISGPPAADVNHEDDNGLRAKW